MNLDRLKDFLNDSGQRIGKYELIRKVGEGGMGVVFEAFDPDLKRSVALKVLKQADADRLRQEGALTGKLRHPNIVTVHEVGPEYLAMDFVRGRSLAEELPAMGRGRRIQVLSTVARAVAYAHHQGVVHRDLKPQNVIVEPSGRIVLTDFGLSGAPVDASVGTPGYAPPAGVTGPAADVYALGVMAREAGIRVHGTTASAIADELEGRLRLRKLVPLALVLLAGAALAWAFWPKDGMDPELHQWRVQEQALTLALERDPHRVECLVERAQIRLARTDYGRNRGRNPLPDYAGAEDDLSRALALRPGVPELLFLRGKVRTQRAVYKVKNGLDPLSDCAAGEEDLLRAGGVPDARTWLGNLRFHRGTWRLRSGGDPSRDFSAADLDLTPADSADRLMRRGRVRAYQKKFEEAETDFVASLQRNPESVWAWTWRGHARAAAGDPTMAAAYFTRAITINPSFSEAWEARGNVRFDLGDFPEAARDLKEAVRLNPSIEPLVAPRLQEALSHPGR